LPLITGRAKGLQTLSEKGLVAKNSYLELEQQRIEQQQDLATRKARSANRKPPSPARSRNCTACAPVSIVTRCKNLPRPRSASKA